MKNIAAVILMLLAAVLGAGADNSPKYEMRAAWIATVYGIDWPSTKGLGSEIGHEQRVELDSMLTRLRRSGFNAVFLQVRPMADALYKSSIEPWSHHLTGKRGVAPDYDPLQFAIDRCHQLGLEIHAWINPFRTVTPKLITNSDATYSKLWMTTVKNGKKISIMNPGLPETRQLIADIVSDISNNYDIDGIVLDDYFYSPEFLSEKPDAADWKQYEASGKKQSIGDWRRANVNKTIRLVHDTLAKIKDGKIRFGVAPQGIAGGNGAHASQGIPLLTGYGVITGDSQYSKIYCDPIAWLLDGSVDYISPQIYWTRDNPKHGYCGLAKWWSDVASFCGRHCFPSVIIARFKDKNSTEYWNEAIAQLNDNRKYCLDGAPGTVFYSATYVSGPRCKGFGDYLNKKAYSAPALVPPMRWKADNSPQPEIKALANKNGVLTWEADGDSRYVVYAIPKSVSSIDALSTDADGIAPDYIVALTYDASFTIPKNLMRGYRFAVAPYDRYGNEWNPVFVK